MNGVYDLTDKIIKSFCNECNIKGPLFKTSTHKFNVAKHEPYGLPAWWYMLNLCKIN